MDWFVVLFYLGIGLYILKKRREFEWIGPVFGKRISNLRNLEKFVEKNRKYLKIISNFMVILMFLASLYSMYLLLKHLLDSILGVKKGPGVTVVLPGFRMPGTGIKVPLIEGFIALFTLIFIHEISHAVISLIRGWKVKSIGYGFLFLLPVAFTEIEREEELIKKPRDAVYISSAGPSANILLSLISLLLLTILAKFYLFITKPYGLKIVGVEENAKRFGLEVGMVILEINGTRVDSVEDMRKLMDMISPGEYLEIKTDKGVFLVKTINYSNKAKIGVYLSENRIGRNKLFDILLPLVEFLSRLLYWIHFLNFAVALINAYPLPFLDGSLFWAAIFKIFIKREKLYNTVVNTFIIVWLAVFLGVVMVPILR